MSQGTIKKLVFEKGFGFISGEKGDVFFHMSSVADNGFDNLREGQKVTFSTTEGPKGPKAEVVRPV